MSRWNAGTVEPMTEQGDCALPSARRGRRMQLRYGFNEVYGWWHFPRASIASDPPPAPSDGHAGRPPLRVRPACARSGSRTGTCSRPVQAVLDAGATPMLTFAKFPPPYDEPRTIRHFVCRAAPRSSGAASSSGAGKGRRTGTGASGTSPTIRRRRRPELPAVPSHLRGGCRDIVLPAGAVPRWAGGPAIGGPAMSVRIGPTGWTGLPGLVTDVDHRLVGFVSWHRYGDWRPAVPERKPRIRPKVASLRTRRLGRSSRPC